MTHKMHKLLLAPLIAIALLVVGLAAPQTASADVKINDTFEGGFEITAFECGWWSCTEVGKANINSKIVLQFRNHIFDTTQTNLGTFGDFAGFVQCRNNCGGQQGILVSNIEGRRVRDFYNTPRLTFNDGRKDFLVWFAATSTVTGVRGQSWQGLSPEFRCWAGDFKCWFQ